VWCARAIWIEFWGWKMSHYQNLLARLSNVRKTPARGNQLESHRANCPTCGHFDNRLSLAKSSDGAILMHCFGGCESIEILNEIGLDFTDLFDEKDYQKSRFVDGRGIGVGGWASAIHLTNSLNIKALSFSLNPTQENLDKFLQSTADFRLVAMESIKKGSAK